MNIISEIVIGNQYVSSKGYLFQVTGRSSYGFNCSVSMVEYVSISDTEDKPSGTKWVLEEEFFLKRFREFR